MEKFTSYLVPRSEAVVTLVSNVHFIVHIYTTVFIKIFKKVNDLVTGMVDGVKSVFHMGRRNTLLFLLYSAIIYLLYIVAGIFIFQAFDYVLLNTHYEYTYTNQTIGKRNNFDYLNFSVETAGNLINAVDRLINKGNSLDSLYYQYIRFEGEYKRYIYWGKDNTLVLRLLAGAGIPYGHSFTLPYEKMFIGGGPNTMRGWPLRRLGGYGLEAQAYSDIALGVGEIMLVSNIEQRFPIVSIFEGAVFADIGNVWDYSSWGIGKDKKLNPSYLLNTIALDAGIGLRANISIITLRLDLALPIYDPGYSVGERWIGTHWSWDKIALNFGINYPF